MSNRTTAASAACFFQQATSSSTSAPRCVSRRTLTSTGACSTSATVRTRRFSGFRRSAAAASWDCALLRVDNVTFTYERGRARGSAQVLDDVSFDVARGVVVGLLGPNGSGKTTLLRIAAGILRPLSGSVSIDGRPLELLTRRELARRIAVVPQETHTTFDFSVMDMVLMGRYPHLGPFELEGAADQEIARQALTVTGTAALATRPFATLSGGEKQRVVIASALAQAS